MKTIIPKLLVLLVFFSFSCSSDSTTPCVPISCLNGGTSTPDCGCNCPQGYTGSNCSFQITPTKITITKISVTDFSNYANSDFNWDVTLPTAANALPDIYFKIVNSVGGDFYVSTTYFKNAMADGTRTFDFVPTTPLEITNPLSIYTFQLYDYDTADSNINNGVDDLMAAKVFSTYSMSGGFPTTLTISDSSIPLSFKLTLNYTW